MARPYKLLRNLLHSFDITNEVLAEELGIGMDTVSRKLNCRSDWTLEQMYSILELIQEPAHRMHEIFPRGGINEPDVKRRKLYRKPA